MFTTPVFLRRFSKILCLCTFTLIFLGGLVKSTESGLSVPDWPTTYGKFMFAFPLDQMVGGIKYEHTHRMLASIVGLLTLSLCILILISKSSVWIKRLSIWAVVLVVLQGILGGLTVLHFLPFWLSSMHGVLAQTFFLIVLMLAYGLSVEYKSRQEEQEKFVDGNLLRWILIFLFMIYVQLILGNLMRHTESGLAIPDFPTMGGALWPSFSAQWLAGINAWRFENNLPEVSMVQVVFHFLHRLCAFLILAVMFFINTKIYNQYLNRPLIVKTLFFINMAIFLQIMLGISTVLFKKEPITTTCHVALGAIVLALVFLLFLRSASISIKNCWIQISK